MKVLVMLSGGVESTALVNHAINNGIEVECLHAVYNRKTITEGIFAKQICEYYNVPYFEATFSNERFNQKYSKIPRKDSVWWAAALLTSAPLGGYNEVWFGMHLEEMSMTASGPIGMNLMLSSVDCEAKLDSPLSKHTKQQQWNSLPDEVKQLVTGCGQRFSKDDKPCGKCEKCEEWKKFAISV